MQNQAIGPHNREAATSTYATNHGYATTPDHPQKMARETAAPTESIPTEVGPPDYMEEMPTPMNWNREELLLFNMLPSEVQEVVVRREEELMNACAMGHQEVQELRRAHEPIQELLGPYDTQFAAAGLDRLNGLRQLLALNDLANQDPVGFVTWFAQQRNIPMGPQVGLSAAGVPVAPAGHPAAPAGLPMGSGISSAAMGQGGMEAPYGQSMQGTALHTGGINPAGSPPAGAMGMPATGMADPNVQRLEAQVGALAQALQKQQFDVEQERQTQEAKRINAFRNAADEQGKPLHPYFDQVHNLMGQLMASGEAGDLNQAYEMAIWAHPQVRQMVLKERQRSAQKETLTKQQNHAKAAALAGKSVAGNPSGATAAPQRNLRDEIARHFQ
uniref:Uncharacterized protein n=1 Tax=Magnetococcus massalia (strain MO-1) TaxID=451514 RepID=A0A1S7LEX2_MAGMO|nr:Protein of unknown function [Candidatus Magnetococcus massalia]